MCVANDETRVDNPGLVMYAATGLGQSGTLSTVMLTVPPVFCSVTVISVP